MPNFQQFRKCPNCASITTAKVCGKCSSNTTALAKWCFLINEYDINGKRKQLRISRFENKRPFKTKTEAQAGYNEWIKYRPIAQNTPTSAIMPTLKEVYANYLTYINTRYKYSSIMECEGICNNYILPVLGNKHIDKINKLDILNFQNGLPIKLSFTHRSRIRGYLFRLLKHGVMFYDLPINVVSLVPPLRNTTPPKEMEFWTLEEFKQFINCVDDITYYTLFNMLYYTGARKGEILALTWKDIQGDTIHIHSSITRKSKNSAFEVTTPKNFSSIRKIKIPNNLINILNDYKESQKFNINDFLFCGDKPLAENTITRYFKKYCDLADVKTIRIHDLRHSHASYLISKGISIVAVAKRLGHKNIEQTLNTYSHLMPNEEEILIKTLEI